MLPNIKGLKQFFFGSDKITDINDSLGFINNYQTLQKGGMVSTSQGMVSSVEDLLKVEKALGKTRDVELDFINNLKEGEDVSKKFTATFSSGISQLGKGIVNLGKTIGATLGKAALSMGISWLATEGVKLIVKVGKMVWDELLTDNGKTQRMQDAIKSLSSVTDEYIKSNENIDSVIEKYEELNTKLSDENITATESLEIKKDLIGLQDELKEAYGSEASNVDLVTGSYEKQLEVLQGIKKEKASDYLKEAEKKPEKSFWDYFIVKPDALKESNIDRVYDYLYGELDKTSKIGTRDLIGKNVKTFKDIYGFDSSILDKYSALNYREMLNPTNDRATMLFDFSGDRKTINDQLSELFTELRNLYPNNPEVQAFMDEVGSIDIGFDSDSYDEAMKEARQIVDALMITDTDDANAYDLQARAEEAVKAYNEALAKYETDRSTDSETALQEASNNLSAIENEIDSYAQKNADYLGNYLRVYEDMFGDIMGGKNKSVEDKLQEKFYDSIDPSKSTSRTLEKEYQQFMRSLDEDDYKLLTTIDIDEFDSLKELRDVLDEMKKTAKNNSIDVDVDVTDTVDSIADLKTAVSSLDDLYNQTLEDKLKLGKDNKYVDESGNVTKSVNDKNQAIGYADPELINNVETAFSKFIKTEKDNNKEVAEMAQALKDFEETMLKFPDDEAKVQAAFDNLITAYIDQTEILDNLDESTAKWAIAQLEAMDITNAESVVMSRLNKTSKNLVKGYEALRRAVEEYNDAVKNNDTEAMGNGIQGITDQLNDMYGFTNQKGEQVNPFDTQFVSQNLDMINAALDEAEGKFNELDRMASKAYIMDLIVNTHDTDISMMYNALYNLMATFDGESIDIGTSMDGTPVVNTLESIRKATAAAVNDWANMVSQMTGGTLSAEIGWETKSVQLNMPEFSYANWKSEGGGAITASNVTKYMKQSVDYHLPKFTYTYTGKGTKANYKPSAPASSGGGGGGGGGGGSSSEPNKPKEESEESFDWIEVAIQRIEEEISRLDKIVGDSYDMWIHRNQALLEEIKKTKDEINAQQLAYKEYLRNAGEVEVNNGKGLNDDDYGENDAEVKKHDQQLLDDAKKAWDTGDYQRKVREGLLTGKDIENIQNHFLSDTIKSYQEMYNKAIAAKDAVKDLQIKLGDLAKTQFDQVKTQAEETLQYFEAYSDLIDKRISRTEEKGYFVSKNYYNQLVNYEKQSLTTLQKEYNDLIAKRDEAVKNGYIASNSEAWYEMNQEILGVAQSIEEATNKLVEFANEMRQIDWDVFDFTQDRISKVNDEFEFLIDLLDNQKLYDDYGIFNSRGWADTALHASKYNTYMQQALDYAKEREKIEGELAKDNADKNLIERREELIQLQQESIQNAYAEKEAVKSLVEQGINLHLSKLQELIDDYKKALSEAKNLYSYQQNITKQTKTIGDLRKQLNAYINDTSEETRALRQRLQTQLNDAEQQLKETQWDKYISETETFLSDMYDDYSETLNKRLDDIDLLMHDMIGEVNVRSKEIGNIIKQVSGEVAYKMTENANTFLKNGTLVSDFKNNFDTYATTTENVLNDIKKYVANISNKTVADAVNTSSVQKSPRLTNHAIYNGVDYSSIFDLNYYMNKYPDLVKAFGDDYDKYIEHFVNHGMKEGRQASETFNVQYYKNKYSDLSGYWGNNWEQYYKHFLNHGIQEGRQGSSTFSVSVYKALYEDLAKVFQNDWKKYYTHYNNHGITEGRRGYAVGTRHIASDQLAWTQENGGELIYRSTDGAILTPLNVGDKVFTADMSENLWNLAQLKQRPVVSTGAGRTVTNNNAITINLPNVQNYEQFKNALQNDPKMTQFIQQVTFGEATNGIKLNKKKY